MEAITVIIFMAFILQTLRINNFLEDRKILNEVIKEKEDLLKFYQQLHKEDVIALHNLSERKNSEIRWNKEL